MPKVPRWLEDRPVLHGLFMGAVLMGLIAALLLISGCAGAPVGGDDSGSLRKPTETPTRGLDEPGLRACNEFARWLAGPEDHAGRGAVAVKVDRLASTSNSGELASKSEVLAKSDVIRVDQNWALAADSFAWECEQLGWTADDVK